VLSDLSIPSTFKLRIDSEIQTTDLESVLQSGIGVEKISPSAHSDSDHLCQSASHDEDPALTY